MPKQNNPPPPAAAHAPPAIRPGALHMARPGTWTDMHGDLVAVTGELLAALAASYDPAIFRAPLVVGHPKTNTPAFGWLASVHADGAGLHGVPIEVDPAFAAAAARYPNRSLSYWPADHPGSPVPGQPYIRHLGVLGATPPAIPGLRGADLAGTDDDLTILTFDFATLTPEPETMTTPAPDPQVVDLAARTAALDARETAAAAQAAALAQTQADLDARLKLLDAREAAAKRAEVMAFAEGLADQARIRPTDVPAFCAILLRLADAPVDVCFAQGDAREPAPGADWLRAYLAQQPPLVELAEIASKARAKGAPSTDDDAKIARRARAFKAAQDAAGNPISFAAAVAACEADEDQGNVA